HGDVSPSNVLIAPTGRPVLVDLAGDPSGEQGTPGFVAPERLAGSPASPAGDVWSLGRLLQWCAGGDRAVTEVLGTIVEPDPRLRPTARDLGQRGLGLGSPA